MAGSGAFGYGSHEYYFYIHVLETIKHHKKLFSLYFTTETFDIYIECTQHKYLLSTLTVIYLQIFLVVKLDSLNHFTVFIIPCILINKSYFSYQRTRNKKRQTSISICKNVIKITVQIK